MDCACRLEVSTRTVDWRLDDDSSTADSRLTTVAPVAQLDRASASGAEGCRFEPCRAHQIGRARLVVVSLRSQSSKSSTVRVDSSSSVNRSATNSPKLGLVRRILYASLRDDADSD